ncbi:transposase [Geobacillus zalihae]|uniref:Transposase n=1 Tax=Geobacillus zalihae TaxID=213419 RepID=A0A7H1RXF2_9BACL|nr:MULTISPECIES: transposase [Bacillaceae]QNU18941.1 transposase [Geobacillus zalihae]WKA48963.1 transposase [Geobacillus zalihae]WMT18461.1 transposase [Parageobacillus toebii]WMT18499.1 transposase [Parageobacillus toebii]
MISNWNSEHAWTYEIDPILEALFRYIDSLSLPETPYVTGRRPVSKKSLLKCFFLKTYFSIDSLRKLVRILQRFRCFQRACGLGEVPHLSTFSRAAKWFREQGFPVFHAQLLKEIERVFNELKSDGLEQPRWYGFHRYVLHVLCCILIHNFEFLL